MQFQRLKDLREDSGKTEDDIAKYLGMRSTVYQRYESGERDIPVWALIKLADFYNTSIEYILSRTDRRALNK